METKLCRLCKKNKPLAKAHILSKGLLKLLSWGEFDGQIIVVDPDGRKPLNRPGGSYDKGILCADCDNKLGIYDKYAKIFVSKSKLKPHPYGRGWVVSGVDQKKLKLFLLSYLWRASLCTLPEFSQVALGSKHEERFRDLIINDNPSDVYTYAVLVTKWSETSNYELLSKLTAIPRAKKIKPFRNLNFYEVDLPNLYRFFVKVDSQHLLDKDLYKEMLGAKPSLTIFDQGPFENSQDYKHLLDLRIKHP